jgi:hypothetical protein
MLTGKKSKKKTDKLKMKHRSKNILALLSTQKLCRGRRLNRGGNTGENGRERGKAKRRIGLETHGMQQETW